MNAALGDILLYLAFEPSGIVLTLIQALLLLVRPVGVIVIN